MFVPAELNNLLIRSNASRGGHPIGASLHKDSGKYTSKLRVDGVSKHLGLYGTAEEAFDSYKVAKELHIKAVAERYKGLVDDRVYSAILNWEVDIND